MYGRSTAAPQLARTDSPSRSVFSSLPFQLSTVDCQPLPRITIHVSSRPHPIWFSSSPHPLTRFVDAPKLRTSYSKLKGFHFKGSKSCQSRRQNKFGTTEIGSSG